MVLLTAILCSYASPPDAAVNRLRAALPLAAKAFLARMQTFKAEEMRNSRVITSSGEWKTVETVSEYKFEVVNGNVREKRRILRSSDPKSSPTASDLGPLILLFDAASIGQYEFKSTGFSYIGADQVLVFDYRQSDGPESLSITQGRRRKRVPIQGQLYVRPSTFEVIKASLEVRRDKTVMDRAEVIYVSGMPAAAVHREFRDGQLVEETIFRYQVRS